MTDHVLPDADALAKEVAQRMTSLVAAMQAAGRTPRVVLTGGTIAAEIYAHLSADGDADWTDVHYYWGDERFVPAASDDRNEKQARDAFLDRLGVPDDNVHAMGSADAGRTPKQAADEYVEVLPDTPFDLVLLGMGPDGHVASLFPGLVAVHEDLRHVVEVFDSPKPPPIRVTMTFATLNHTLRTWFLVSGEGKADAVAAAHTPGEVAEIPARGTQGIDETLWLMDEAAASRL